MIERKARRQMSYAKVLIEGRTPAYIRDMSSGGFRVYSPVPLSYDEGGSIRCMIIPEDRNESAFELSGEIRWNRRESDGDNVMGILISSFSSEAGKKQYASLLSLFTKETGES